jgi:hypothetical protein
MTNLAQHWPIFKVAGSPLRAPDPVRGDDENREICKFFRATDQYHGVRRGRREELDLGGFKRRTLPDGTFPDAVGVTGEETDRR